MHQNIKCIMSNIKSSKTYIKEYFMHFTGAPCIFKYFLQIQYTRKSNHKEAFTKNDRKIHLSKFKSHSEL